MNFTLIFDFITPEGVYLMTRINNGGNYTTVKAYLKAVLLFVLLFLIYAISQKAQGQSPAPQAAQTTLTEETLERKVWVELVELNKNNFEDVNHIAVGEMIERPDGARSAEPGDHIWATAEELMGHYGLWHRWIEWTEAGNSANVQAFLKAELPEIFDAPPAVPPTADTEKISGAVLAPNHMSIHRGWIAPVIVFVIFLLAVVSILRASLLAERLNLVNIRSKAEKDRDTYQKREAAERTKRKHIEKENAKWEEYFSRENEVLTNTVKAFERENIFLKTHPPEELVETELPEALADLGNETHLIAESVSALVARDIDETESIPFPPEKVVLFTRAGTVRINTNSTSEDLARFTLSTVPGWRIWIRNNAGQDRVVYYTALQTMEIVPMHSADIKAITIAETHWDKAVSDEIARHEKETGPVS